MYIENKGNVSNQINIETLNGTVFDLSDSKKYEEILSAAKSVLDSKEIENKEDLDDVKEVIKAAEGKNKNKLVEVLKKIAVTGTHIMESAAGSALIELAKKMGFII